MTAVTPETVSEAARPRPGFLASSLAPLLVRIRSVAQEGLRTTVARAIEEAFAGFHREMRS